MCISANYRLAPAARFPEQLVDVKKVIAWAREHAQEYVADTAWVFVAGSSSGGHLASLAGLTPNDPSFQPGFERADTSVTAVISLFGYYSPFDINASRSFTPFAYARPDAPPFFVAHGDLDTWACPRVEVTSRINDVGIDMVHVEPDGTAVLMIVGQVPFDFTGVVKIDLDTGEVIHESYPLRGYDSGVSLADEIGFAHFSAAGGDHALA